MNTHEKKRKMHDGEVFHLFVCHEAKRDFEVGPDYNPERCPLCKMDVTLDL